MLRKDEEDTPLTARAGIGCCGCLVVEIGAPERSPGETVIDLGSDADFDVFLADKRVGESGRVIGIDMNKVKRLPSQAVLSPS